MFLENAKELEEEIPLTVLRPAINHNVEELNEMINTKNTDYFTKYLR